MSMNIPSSRYLELIQRFPLRPLGNDDDLDAAIKLAETLEFRNDLDPTERDYLEVLTALIERYEDQHHPIEDISGLEAIKSLIEFRGVTQAEVARATGIGESVLSAILHGRRAMGRKTIGKLANYFHVHPGVFLTSTATTAEETRMG